MHPDLYSSIKEIYINDIKDIIENCSEKYDILYSIYNNHRLAYNALINSMNTTEHLSFINRCYNTYNILLKNKNI